MYFSAVSWPYPSTSAARPGSHRLSRGSHGRERPSARHLPPVPSAPGSRHRSRPGAQRPRPSRASHRIPPARSSARNHDAGGRQTKRPGSIMPSRYERRSASQRTRPWAITSRRGQPSAAERRPASTNRRTTPQTFPRIASAGRRRRRRPLSAVVSRHAADSESIAGGPLALSPLLLQTTTRRR
jgi:hypothetical protein